MRHDYVAVELAQVEQTPTGSRLNQKVGKIIGQGHFGPHRLSETVNHKGANLSTAAAPQSSFTLQQIL